MGMRNVIIRPIAGKDALPAYQAIRESLTEVSPWMSSLQESTTLDDVQAWIERSQGNWSEGVGYSFAIIDPNEDIFLGGCNLWVVDQHHCFANLAYWVRTSQTGRGLATQALRLAAAFAFREVGLLRVEIVVAEPNLASQRVAEKAGATREGLLRNRITIHGKTYNAWIFSLIPADFKEKNENSI